MKWAQFHNLGVTYILYFCLNYHNHINIIFLALHFTLTLKTESYILYEYLCVCVHVSVCVY